MINTGKRVHAFSLGGIQLQVMQLATIFGQSRKRIAHISGARLLQVDEFEPGYRFQDISDRLCNSGRTRMFVQSDPFFNTIPK